MRSATGEHAGQALPQVSCVAVALLHHGFQPGKLAQSHGRVERAHAVVEAQGRLLVLALPEAFHQLLPMAAQAPRLCEDPPSRALCYTYKGRANSDFGQVIPSLGEPRVGYRLTT